MRLTVYIDDREAIPVRALPFITGYSMAPKQVAAVFSHTWSNDDSFTDVQTYHLSSASPSAILPKEWDLIRIRIEALSKRLKAKESPDYDSNPEWYEQAFRCLPPGVFVWRDVFETAFRQSYSPYQRQFLLGERSGDRDLNYEPMLVYPDAEVAIFEGFPEVTSVDRENSSRQVTERATDGLKEFECDKSATENDRKFQYLDEVDKAIDSAIDAGKQDLKRQADGIVRKRIAAILKWLHANEISRTQAFPAEIIEKVFLDLQKMMDLKLTPSTFEKALKVGRRVGLYSMTDGRKKKSPKNL